MNVRVNDRSHRNCGVTLLELILALSLSILVLMSISMAINLHFRMLDVRRTNVEEAQVARVALKRIADDLRGVVQFTPPDLSGLTAIGGAALEGASDLAAAAGQQSGGGTGGATGGGGATDTGGGQGQGTGGGQTGQGGQASSGGQTGQNAGGNSTGGSGQSASGSGSTAAGQTGASGQTASSSSTTSSQQTSSATGSTASTTEETAEASVVGLYGTNFEMRIDISRLPRLDEYQGTLSTDGSFSLVDIPSDLKTVAYFILDEEASGAARSIGVTSGAIKPSATGRGRGLMRSEMSRAVIAYAESNGEVQSAYDNGRMLADEVVAIQFQYFDGAEWLTEWDSKEMGGLPKAVEIVLTLLPTYAMTEEALSRLPADAPPPEQIYRLVVNLPGAPLVASSSTETATDTSAESTSGSTSAQGSTSSTGQGAMP